MKRWMGVAVLLLVAACKPAADNSAAEGDKAPVAPEMPEGTMDPQSRFYIARLPDALAHAALQQQGVTMTIKGARQMGKSSLLYRLAHSAAGQGKRVVLLDFQLFERESLASFAGFLRQFCAWISYELDIEDRVAEYWRVPLSNTQCCTHYFRKYLLPQVGGPLVLALDEVDRVFEAPFRADFFGMLRSWHNARQGLAADVWRHLDLVLVTSTEPYHFITDSAQSPFNVGAVLDLQDFTPEQVAELNARYPAPWAPGDLQGLIGLVGGHPYLVRQAFYLVAAGHLTAADLLARAGQDAGPFDDHLRYHLYRLQDAPALGAAFRQILHSGTCPDERLFLHLRGAGLVKREGEGIVARCRLYAGYFGKHLR
jgi:hypothetical protein